MPHEAPHELRSGGLSQAVLRVIDAGHHVVLDRIDLAALDAQRLALRALSAAVFLTAAAVCLTGAWFALLAVGVVVALAYVSLACALGMAAGASLAVGAALIAVAVRHQRAGNAPSPAAPQSGR